jgi:nucleoside triphosphate pyrophosphatase
MPSSLRSKTHSGPVTGSCVSVAAIGSSQLGNAAVTSALYLEAGAGALPDEPPFAAPARAAIGYRRPMSDAGREASLHRQPGSPERPPLVLASASRSRAALLTQAGIEHELATSGVDESAIAAPTPAELVERLAEAKARAVAASRREALVLGCDSLLGIDGRVLGKPESREAALEHWRLIAGRTTTLFTGHCLLHVQGGNVVAHAAALAQTDVHIGRPTPAELDAYVASGEPLGSAGGFTLEGRSAPFIEGIAGSPSNVIGLSLPVLGQLLQRLGFSVVQFWQSAC